MTLIFGKSYNVKATWGPRAETPEALADRFVTMIDSFQSIDPLLTSWMVERKTYEWVRANGAKYMKSKVSKDDFGEIWEMDGYSFFAYTKGQPNPLSFDVRLHIGSSCPGQFVNEVEFGTDIEGIPAPEAITYEIFRRALLDLVKAWVPDLCFAYPHELIHAVGSTKYLRPHWMLYVAPQTAPLVTPPQSAINERLDDGGLLMTATNETFKVDNPDHMAIARDIGAAVAHLPEEE
jgi:hypothetical protein